MRTSRCILYTAIGTVLSLLYVFQQTEIVKLGYKITLTENVLEAAQDRRTSLEYTLSSLESPLSLDKNLFLNKDEFEIARSYKLVKVGIPKKEGVLPADKTRVAREGRLSLWKRLASASFFAGPQAEAKTLR